MQYPPMMILFSAFDPKANDGADLHADRRAADAANAELAKSQKSGTFLGRLLPKALRALLARRQERLYLRDAVHRLSETSPHLLADIGMAATPDVAKMEDLGTQLAKDVALPEPMIQFADARRTRPAPAKETGEPLLIAAE